MSLGAEMLDHAAALSAVARGLSDEPYVFTEAGRLAPGAEDTFWKGQFSFLEIYVEGEIESTTEGFEGHWRDPDDSAPLPSADRAALEEPMRSDAGLPLSHLENLFIALVEAARRRKEPAVALRAELLEEVSAETNIPEIEVDRALRYFELRPRDEFYPSADDKTEVQPWHFNREFSYNRRPLLIRETERGEEVIWGMRHLMAAWVLFVSYLLDAKFRPQSDELRVALGSVSDVRGKAFEDRVADIYEAHERFQVLRRRDKLNGVPVVRDDGQDLDVLVAEASRKRLIAADAKDVSPSLTPSDVARELGRSFETRGSKKAAMDKHLERVAWLKAHVADALIEFGLPAEGAQDWSVEGLIVTDHDVISPHMTKTPLPVLSVRQLRKNLNKRPPPMKKRRVRRN